MRIAIIIPARYASTRLPGKPFAKIAGKEMLLRVWELALKAASNYSDAIAYIATDDEKIETFCHENNMNCIMTSPDCASGTDRVAEAVSKLDYTPDFVINLQGDNPLCPPWFIDALIQEFEKDNSIEMSTPVVNLTWDALDQFRKNKQTTPFSGTCAVMDKKMNAMYFSKNIIPAIRKEDKQREKLKMSPVFRQPGLYGYTPKTLETLRNLSATTYSELEGLEMLRFMENEGKVRCVPVDYQGRDDLAYSSGVDSPEDLARTEALIAKYGEF